MGELSHGSEAYLGRSIITYGLRTYLASYLLLPLINDLQALVVIMSLWEIQGTFVDRG